MDFFLFFFRSLQYEMALGCLLCLLWKFSVLWMLYFTCLWLLCMFPFLWKLCVCDCCVCCLFCPKENYVFVIFVFVVNVTVVKTVCLWFTVKGTCIGNFVLILLIVNDMFVVNVACVINAMLWKLNVIWTLGLWKCFVCC